MLEYPFRTLFTEKGILSSVLKSLEAQEARGLPLNWQVGNPGSVRDPGVYMDPQAARTGCPEAGPGFLDRPLLGGNSNVEKTPFGVTPQGALFQVIPNLLRFRYWRNLEGRL